MRILALAAFAALLIAPSILHAENRDREYLEKARVIDAGPSMVREVPGLGVSQETQTVTVEVLEGPDAGTRATFVNDFTQVEDGDLVYVRHAIAAQDGPETWIITDPYRLDVLLAVAGAFLIVLFLFGGLQGIRALATLGGSLVLIFFLLLPNVYAGHSPILVSIGVASLIIVIGSYITHGFNRTTTVAMLGMIGTVLVTGAATYAVIHAAKLSGFTSENNAYLNFMTEGRIDMIGLLFGGIIIGLLGILYDVAIGQAVTVEELLAAGAHYTRRQAFLRAMRVGREHIGALVNTLAIAYVGSSLPLLLLFRESSAGIAYTLNSEIFATEVIRILMGSIGLVLAVPVTTALAAWLTRQGLPVRDGHGHAHAAHTPKNSSE